MTINPKAPAPAAPKPDGLAEAAPGDGPPSAGGPRPAGGPEPDGPEPDGPPGAEAAAPAAPDQAGDPAERLKRLFLGALAESGNVSAACRRVLLPRHTAYGWRRADPAFAKAWAEALEIGLDALEDEATRRALEGVEEPVFYQGEVRGAVRRFSDPLLMFLLRARRPERFREGSHAGASPAIDVTGARERLERRLADLARRARQARVPRQPD
ncbi:MAG: hypothetical protein HY521_15080 [Proteobacteria bacterium]|nr:hypothetical protein [Pseudomonadota bacterium]